MFLWSPYLPALPSFPTRRSSDLACFRIDLAFADRTSVREYRIVHLVVGDDGEAARQFLGQEGFRRVSRQFQKAVRPQRAWRRERSEEHTSELQSPDHLVCRLLLE